MKFADHLSKSDIQKFNQMRRGSNHESEPTPKVKKKDSLSRRDWEDIIGISRDTYKRVGGAVRRK